MNLLGVHSSPSCKTQPQMDSRQNGPRPNSHWGAIGLLLWDKKFLNCSAVWAYCFTVWCHGEMQKKKKRWKVYVQWHRNSDSVSFERIPLEVLSAASAAHLGKRTKKIPPSSLRFDAIQYNNTAMLQPDKLNLSDSESCKVQAGSSCCQVTLFYCVRFCVKPL